MAATSTSHLLLTRIDHEAKMLNVMRNLFEDGHLTDVTLVCEGQLIHAHRLILSSVSNYFQTIFQNPMLKSQNNPVIVVKDMKMADLVAIIEFVYSGEVRIHGDQLESLVKSAETLDISGLNKIDPNPVNHKASQSSNKSIDSTDSSIDSSFEKKSTTGSTGKTNSHNFQNNSPLLRKESGTNSRTSCDKKTEITNSSVRGTRSRCPNEPSERNSGVTGGRKGNGSQENLTSSKNPITLADENKKREARYMSRAQLRESLMKMHEPSISRTIQNSPKKSLDLRGLTVKETMSERRSSSSICEPISKGKNSTNGDQTKNENNCCKELASGQKLTNISNKTPEFKKPLEPAKKTKGNLLPEVYPSTETDDYMKQFVCNKERLSMNLRRDDDVQSISSVTTRSRRTKQLEESGCDKKDTSTPLSRTVSPSPSNQSGTSARTKRTAHTIKSPTDLGKQKQVKKPEPVKTQTTSSTDRSTRSVRLANSARWKTRAAKLKVAVASTRLSAKSRSSKVDWKAWFESQAKMLQNATNKRVRKEERPKQAVKAKSDETTLENNKDTQSNAQLNKPITISHMPNPFARKIQEQNPEKQHEILEWDGTGSLEYQPTTTNPNSIRDLTNEFELEFAPTPKPKRKQVESSQLDMETCKRDLTPTSQSQATTSSSATVTRNLRPKRVKTTSDSSDNPPSTSTANTSASSLYTTASISPIPTTSTINLISSQQQHQQQPSGDTNV
ncbi:broad-complex core protein-like [Panonychus citri]|uniref:broad-complex core protein-like n=1 Tax=Panonychus citri TaxID=50023 RepID=UPI002306FC33|nr:broad-complex core protein-like [Panonychus citri]